jgi:hypothetical protein
VARASDPSEEHKQIYSDDEVEIVVDVPRRISKAKPQPQSKYKSRRKSQQQPASTPPPVHASISVHTSSPSPSPPPSSPDVDSLAGLPLTILPAPARTEIVVPPRALSHLQTSSTPPSDDSRTQQMQRQTIRQGFCYEGSATGAHGLLAKNSPAAAELTTPLADTALAPPHLVPGLDLNLDLDVSMGLADSDGDGDGVTDDEAVVPARTEIVVPPRALSHPQTSSTPSDDSRTQQMQRQTIRQGFCYEGSATGAHGLLAKNSPAAAELTTPLADSGACATTSGSEPALDLNHDLEVGLADSDADADEVTDDEVGVPSPTPHTPHPLLRSSGTHDHPDGPMLGFVVPEHADADPVAGTSLDHADATPDRGLHVDLTPFRAAVKGGPIGTQRVFLVVRTPARKQVSASTLGMGRPARRCLGKGKGKSCAVPTCGVVDSPSSVGASSSTRVQRKRRRKLLPDETEAEHWIQPYDNDDDGEHKSDEDGPRAHALSALALVHLDARPDKRQRTTTSPSPSSSGMTLCHHCKRKTPRPKMRCTLIVTSVGVLCRKLFCNACVEKRCVLRSFLPYKLSDSWSTGTQT